MKLPLNMVDMFPLKQRNWLLEKGRENPQLPKHLLIIKSEESRLLKQVSKQNEQRKKVHTQTVSYR